MKSLCVRICLLLQKNAFINHCEHELIEHVYFNHIISNCAETDNSTEEELNRHFLEEFLKKVSEDMPPQRRKVFLMSKLEGRSNQDISEELNISQKTVERHMTMALEKIKGQLRRHYNMFSPVAIFISFII